MRRADYGIDAPGMVRLLLIVGAVILVACLAGLYLAEIRDRLTPDVCDILRSLRPAGASMLLAGFWMLWCSRVGKFWVCRQLIGQRAWRGNERVLDIGCGRGLSLIAVARQLGEGGHATGIDLWSAKDLSGNAPSHTLANATIEGVTERVGVDTGDACALPYADASFDVVTSMTALHNIPSAAGRTQAFAEAVRVLKPGGQLLLFDILHPFVYPRELARLGLPVRRVGFWPLWVLPGVTLSGIKP